MLLALGFLGAEQPGLSKDPALNLDRPDNVRRDANYTASLRSVFACADMRRTQSFGMGSIWKGREWARSVAAYVFRRSDLLPSVMP